MRVPRSSSKWHLGYFRVGRQVSLELITPESVSFSLRQHKSHTSTNWHSVSKTLAPSHVCAGNGPFRPTVPSGRKRHCVVAPPAYNSPVRICLLTFHPIVRTGHGHGDLDKAGVQPSHTCRLYRQSGSPCHSYHKARRAVPFLSSLNI